MARKIFLVMACTDYDGNDPVRAFETQTDAIDFKERCAAHLGKMPQCPHGDFNEAGYDDKFDKFIAAKERWRGRSPAGNDLSEPSFFSVIELPLSQQIPRARERNRPIKK